MQATGATAASAALLLAGCSSDDPTPEPVNTTLVSLGSNDVGLLNYVYLLKQLQAAFYQKVLDNPPTDLQAGDLAFLNDLRDHEVIHRETLRFALGNQAITTIPIDFTTVTLTTRAGVLATAKRLEDLGSAGIAGILRLVLDQSHFATLLKISSVENRHSTFIRDVLSPAAGTFATDVVVNTPPLLSVAATQTPAQVTANLAPFFLPLSIFTDSLPSA
ncbi:hypothetical protein GCM10023185_41150 [Hymenobacter saemangeumensis]|uniref:Ferritin-like domain-containing protein n=1 Tax=Hymenobacter saemangeumensis TaxID=1084522 RepID=A0ABP8IRS3_9BACT